MEGLLEALAGWPVARALRASMEFYAAVNAAHILGIGLIVGALATLDLRLLGAFRAAPLAALGPPLSRVAACGVVLAAATGFLLFSVRPAEYVQNPAFLTKIALVAFGVLNALLLHAGAGWKTVLGGGAASPGLRLSAALSLLTWIGAVLAGRWIGFSE